MSHLRPNWIGDGLLFRKLPFFARDLRYAEAEISSPTGGRLSNY